MMPSKIFDINRKHKLNVNYFTEINDENKAYWLGFLWADGNISKTTQRASGPNRMRISQKITEERHLQKFMNAINCDYQLQQKQSGYGKTYLDLDINSRPFCQSLENLGFANKDQRINIPPIDETLYRHFIRGYFDGDGCLSVYIQTSGRRKIPRQEWSITGNPIFIQNMRHILEEQANTTPTIKIKTYKKTNKAVSLRYGKAEDIEKLYDYLYKDSHVFMKSKHAKFIEYFKRKKERK